MIELLKRVAVEKPWGQDELPGPFAEIQGRRIGEIWFDTPESARDLLIKYIFAAEKLSIQVHPSDAQTSTQGLGLQGKEECWLVVDAEPGARLGIGFSEPMTSDALRESALDGSIVEKMVWHDVAKGDFFYIPAGTVHAIGEGICVVEIQQHSDITYRLFDYGRPRELHLDAGVDVALGEIYDIERWYRRLGSTSQCLVDGPFFRVDHVTGLPDWETLKHYLGKPAFIIPIDGGLSLDGMSVPVGNCGFSDSLSESSLLSPGDFLLVGASPLPRAADGQRR